MTERPLSGYTCAYCSKDFATYREADEHAKIAHPAQYIEDDSDIGPTLAKAVDEYARGMPNRRLEKLARALTVTPDGCVAAAFAELDGAEPPGHAQLALRERREKIAAMAMSALLSRLDGKLPVQEMDRVRWVGGAAALAVQAADALLLALEKDRQV
jgi:hypothetical protein